MTTENLIHVTQHHLVFRGTAREMGRQQGELIRDFPQAVGYFGSGPFPKTSAPVDKTLRMMETYCPGLVDEMDGFCDATGIPLEKLAYLAMTHIGGKHCSHFAVLPAATENGHVLVGRNYDFSEKVDDLKLITVLPQNANASLGFSTLFFGRNDGINEHGLSVTMSAGGMPVGIEPGMQAPIQDGLQFWALVRTLLDSCKTVEEAEECITGFPCSGNPILILADKSGQASLVEIHGPDKKIVRIGGERQYIAATNHFQTDGLKKIDPTCMRHSSVRLKSINRFLEENSGKITIENIKRFLGTEYPDGPTAHFYSEWFGTLHSCVYDLNDCFVDVTFGSPATNDWHRTDLANPQPGVFDSILPDQHTSPDFWMASN
ncbi:MAG: linear amide C-N hydrolase [Leptolinea sp.]|nr:linear amide C-N hydrolase [Leptolinea sp.]